MKTVILNRSFQTCISEKTNVDGPQMAYVSPPELARAEQDKEASQSLQSSEVSLLLQFFQILNTWDPEVAHERGPKIAHDGATGTGTGEESSSRTKGHIPGLVPA